MKNILLILFFFIPYIFSETLPKKVIFIGASSGIGKALAKKFSEHQWIVGLAARRITLLEALQKELPNKSYIKRIDVTDSQYAPQLLQELIDEMGGIDTLVINAGICPEAFTEISDSVIPYDPELQTIHTNVIGFTAIANAAFNYFIKKGRGHVVGISSISGLRGEAVCPAYSGSKAFISRYLEAWRNKCAFENLPIIVTDIMPGFVDTYDFGKDAYWVEPVEKAAEQIYVAITNQVKLAYITKRWRLIAWLLAVTPDWLYYKVGGF